MGVLWYTDGLGILLIVYRYAFAARRSACSSLPDSLFGSLPFKRVSGVLSGGLVEVNGFMSDLID